MKVTDKISLNLNIDLVVEHFAITRETIINSEALAALATVKKADIPGSGYLGWMDFKNLKDTDIINRIKGIAARVRQEFDAFVIIGIGGSNQGARAGIDLLQDSNDTMEIHYLGNNLSPGYAAKILSRLKGKSVYFNVIAKNETTLEPGVGFRLARAFIRNEYGEGFMGAHLGLTATPGSSMEDLGYRMGADILPFPMAIGGRFSVLSPVGLFPMAVAGIDIGSLLLGAETLLSHFDFLDPFNHPALIYSALRNHFYRQGFSNELFTFFHPVCENLGRWWVQLFGESEGKDNKGIYPSMLRASEDLHSLGQYVQDGKRQLMELFLNIPVNETDILIKDDRWADGFHYLNSLGLKEINEKAYEGTMSAHSGGGVPVMELTVNTCDAYSLGQLFFFFEYACYLSALIIRVNPFDQPGVEIYKKYMFDLLGRK